MIFRSPHPDITIPELPLSRYVLEGGRTPDSKVAIVDGTTGRETTYAELRAGVRAAAAGLAARGVTKGDVIAIWSPNLPEYPVAFLAALTLGAVVTTLNPRSTAEEVAHQLRDAGARLLITVPELVGRAHEAVSRTAGGSAVTVEEVLVFGKAEGATPFASLQDGDADVPAVSLDPKVDLAVLPYSSGTTGKPKGVMLTHYNLVANVAQLMATEPVPPDEVAIAVLPFFHIYGMIVVMSASLRAGATVVTLPRFELEGFLGALERYRVTRANLVPPIILTLAKHPLVSRFDLSHLRFIGSGAAPLGAATAHACAERLGCPVLQGYGLTETSPVTHWMCADARDADRLGSVGPSVPNTEVKIVRLDTGETCGPGEQGEVWVRGPQVMKGYLNRPDATAAMLDAGGWLHTGDIGYVDEEGYLYLVDRAKELIKYKGFQVAPAELEELLLTHPAVADVAVIPGPDEEAGEVPTAFVVLRDGSRVEADALLAFVAERVAPHKKVRRLEFTDEIPKSASGKILRRVLVERERQRAKHAKGDSEK